MPKQWTSVAGVMATGRRMGRRLTASSRVLPDFLVIGAQKAGTTSLGWFLRLHPDIFWVPRAEMHYFDRDYDRGLKWYRSWFERRSVMEAHERRTGRLARAGEKTPAYLVLPDGPDRVAGDLPDVRLVVSLRDPVRRAYSQWSMNVRVGRESLSFLDALDAEPERLAAVDLSAGVSGSAYLEHGYAMRSNYADHLERWLARFDRSQVFVYRSEDLYADPDPGPIDCSTTSASTPRGWPERPSPTPTSIPASRSIRPPTTDWSSASPSPTRDWPSSSASPTTRPRRRSFDLLTGAVP